MYLIVEVYKKQNEVTILRRSICSIEKGEIFIKTTAITYKIKYRIQ